MTACTGGHGWGQAGKQPVSARYLSTKRVLKQFDSPLEEKKGSVGFSNSGARTFLPDVVVGFLWSVLQCYSVQGMGDSSGYFQKSSS